MVEFVTLFNPNTVDVAVSATYLFDAGADAISRSHVVAAGRRIEIKVDDEVGEGRDVAVSLTSTGGPIVAERTMYFAFNPGGGQVDGGDASPGAQPAQSWYFAEGFTGPGFHEYLALLNPSSGAASVTITYQFADATSRLQSLSLAGRSRTTVDVNAAVGPGREVSAMVTSSVPVVAERPMYFNACVPGLCMSGGHVAMGGQPATTAHFAEGYTGQGFQQYLTIQNPNASPAGVVITYMFADGGSATRTASVGAGSRLTVDTNAAIGGWHQVSTRVQSDLPVVTERPIYFNACVAGVCTKGGDIAPGLQPASTWYFAAGSTASGFHEYLVLENPGPAAASVVIGYVFPDGNSSEKVTVNAGSRTTVDVNASVGPARQVAMSITSSVPVVAERPVYFAAFDPLPHSAPRPPPGGSQQQQLINQDRAAAGLPALAWSPCLASVAAASDRRMTAQGFISHANAPSENLACDLGSSQGGENVGYDTAGIDDSMLNDAFMKSPGHRDNIMGPYRYVGTAWQVDSRGWGFIAVEFA